MRIESASLVGLTAPRQKCSLLDLRYPELTEAQRHALEEALLRLADEDE
jgi:hypothetical protein